MALEDTLRVLRVEGKKLTGSLTDLREGELDAPDLLLAAEAVLTAESELLVEALLLERTTRRLEGLAVVAALASLDHFELLSC